MGALDHFSEVQESFLTLVFHFERVSEENLTKSVGASTHKFEKSGCLSTHSTHTNGGPGKCVGTILHYTGFYLLSVAPRPST